MSQSSGSEQEPLRIPEPWEVPWMGVEPLAADDRARLHPRGGPRWKREREGGM